jgi:hypothetical protein
MFKKIRIAILLFILFLVGANAYLTQLRSTDWDQSLEVVIFPVNGDNSTAAADYINTLTRDTFRPIERFMQTEGEGYELSLADPVIIELAPEVQTLPPPAPFGANIFAVMFWSLKLRYWSWKNDTYEGPLANIKVFVLFCMVKAFASRHQAARNNVIITHEMLHTLGATDKYDLQTLLPNYPDGYADPEQKPLYPQQYGEIMGRGIAVSATEIKLPPSLGYTVIGPQSAREIKWID